MLYATPKHVLWFCPVAHYHNYTPCYAYQIRLFNPLHIAEPEISAQENNLKPNLLFWPLKDILVFFVELYKVFKLEDQRWTLKKHRLWNFDCSETSVGEVLMHHFQLLNAARSLSLDT